MPVEKGLPGGTDPDTIRARLGLPPKHPSKPASEEEIFAHLQGKKPTIPVSDEEIEFTRRIGSIVGPLFGNDRPEI